MDPPAKVEVVDTIPKMSAGSAVCPTARVTDGTLVLAFSLPSCDDSAVIRFDGVLTWSYGYPNDEGLGSHPLWGHGIELYEFHVSPIGPDGTRWCIATFHDGTLTVNSKTVQVLAEKLPLKPWEAIDAVVGPGENRVLDYEY
ncbi:MAG TPA: hypothetical protein VEI07_01020 [Planctomycetaceae bacterium]|nr:hypothetical protein [Planctomycetaceae bacterium]